jgi:hypothetical protein
LAQKPGADLFVAEFVDAPTLVAGSTLDGGPTSVGATLRNVLLLGRHTQFAGLMQLNGLQVLAGRFELGLNALGAASVGAAAFVAFAMRIRPAIVFANVQIRAIVRAWWN